MGRRKKLTREQVLGAINQWLVAHGVPPSIEELRKILRVGSKRTISRYLEWLEESGDIERLPGTARALRPLRAVSRGLQTRAVPLVGQAPAGPWMLAEENREAWIRLPQQVAPAGSKFFLLRVRGDSMNEARVAGLVIEDGDLILVRQQTTAEPGEIVVALLDGEATIKRLVAGEGYFVLKPESTNREHQPILVDREIQVQGVVVRVFKKGSEILRESFN